MEPSPEVESSPPKVMEALTGLLIPPACREEVLGDLHERYRSPRQYFVDAVRTVPMVIMSRIRRTTDPIVFLMESFTLYASFLIAAWGLDRTILYSDSGFAKLAIPGAVTMIVLVLSDAYAHPARRSPLKPILVAALGIGFAFVVQAIFQVLPRAIMIAGGGISILLISTLRMLFPPIMDRPRGANGPAFWQRLELPPITISPQKLIVAVLVLIVLYRIAIRLV
jgi:hypothetical protein